MLRTATAITAGLLGVAAAAQNDPSGDSLRSLADRLGMQYGTWHYQDHFMADTISHRIDEREFEVMSFGAFGAQTQTSEGVWDYGKVDQAIDRVQGWSGDRDVMGIYLAGPNAYMPDWWKASARDGGYGDAGGQTHSQLLETHINEVVGRYADRIDSWGVVNEALKRAPAGESVYNEQNRWTHTNNQVLNKVSYDGFNAWEPMTWQGQAIKNDNGSDATMPVFIRQAFEQARAADPTAKLYYNDVANAAIGERHTEIQYDLVRALLDKGVSIDGVGMQMHLNVQKADGRLRNNKGDLFDIDGFVANVQRYRDLGVEVYLSELDIRVPENASAGDLQRQRQAYYDVVHAAARSGAVNSIIQWGPDDSIAWNREHTPTLFSGADAERNAKPAYFGAQEGLYDAIVEGLDAQQIDVTAAAGLRQVSRRSVSGDVSYSISETRRRVGRQGSNSSAVVVLPFLLPELDAGQVIELARLDVTTDQADASSSTGIRPNIDLYGLGFRGTDEVVVGDYFAGSGAVQVGEVLLSRSMVGGEMPFPDGSAPFEDGYWTLGETFDLAAYLNSLYAAGAVGGEDYVFLRLNLDEAGYDSSRWAMLAGGADASQQPRLSFFVTQGATIPEPGAAAALVVSLLPMMWRRSRGRATQSVSA